MDEAVSAAHRALEGPWGKMTVGSRTMLLRKVADRIEQRSEEFVAAEASDTGKPFKVAGVSSTSLEQSRTFVPLRIPPPPPGRSRS